MRLLCTVPWGSWAGGDEDTGWGQILGKLRISSVSIPSLSWQRETLEQWEENQQGEEVLHSPSERKRLSPSARWGDRVLPKVTHPVSGKARSPLRACLGFRDSPTGKLPPLTPFWAAKKFLSVGREHGQRQTSALDWKRTDFRRSEDSREQRWRSCSYGNLVGGQATFSLSTCPLAACPSPSTKTSLGEFMASWTIRLCAYFLQREWPRFKPKCQGLFGFLYLSRILC